jgi:hypothetical protein
MLVAGSAGCTSGVSAEIFTERLSRGSGPLGPRSLNAGFSLAFGERGRDGVEHVEVALQKLRRPPPR